MEILYFHQYFSTRDGSNGTRSYEFAKSLTKNGHKVTIVCLNCIRSNTGLKNNFVNGVRKGVIDNFNIIEFDLDYSNSQGFYKRTLVFLEFCLKSTLLALRSDADILISSSTPLTISIPGIFFRWIKRKTFIFEVRDLWPELPIKMGIIKNPVLILLLRCLENISYLSADACIGLAPGICDSIKKCRKDKEQIFFLPNGCDLNLFKFNNIKKDKKELSINGISSDDFIAVFAGAHGEANGLNQVILAAEYLIKLKRNDIKILFIGEGKLKDELINYVNTKNLTNCFFLGSIPKIELAEIFNNFADVGLMVLKNVPSFYNGTSPNKFFDYISSGLPVINNYPGWLASIIQENNIGKVVDPYSSKEFAEALITIADNKEYRDQMGSNARYLAEQRFSRNKISKRFIRVIEMTYRRTKNRTLLNQNFFSYELFKSICDIFCALIFLIILSPFLLLISTLIYFILGKPIIFKQIRVGLKGNLFTIYKFRTMKDIRDISGNLLEDNKRLSRFGDFLRKTSIDELPTLINIIKGEMSFIGPRPLLKEYLPLYSKRQFERHLVKPGLSGWAQIKGRNAVSWQRRFANDNWYVDNKSFLLDIYIFFATIKKVFFREGITPKNKNFMDKWMGNRR